jgi:hypothetical protein
MNNYPGLLRHLLRLSWGNYSGLFKANFLKLYCKGNYSGPAKTITQEC